MNLKNLYEDVCDNENYEQIMSNWINIFNELLVDLKSTNSFMSNMVFDDLYTSVYGEHFNKETALQAVSHMKNVDNTSGEHWSIEQTTSAAKQSNITFKTFNEYDFYYVLNMLYSDYYTIFKDNSDMYIQIAIAWLSDPDVCEGKAWRYYKKVVDIC